MLEESLLFSKFLFRKSALNFETIVRFSVSGVKKHLAHRQFFLVPEISELLPGTCFPRGSGLFGTRSESRSKSLAVCELGFQVKGETWRDSSLGSR